MIKQLWNNTINTEQFSGVFSASDARGILFEACHGFRNRGEDLPVNRDTAFSIASGTKLFYGPCRMQAGGSGAFKTLRSFMVDSPR